MLLPPPFNLLCLQACEGSDYQIVVHPEEDGTGQWPGSGDIDLDDCEPLTVTQRVIDTLSAEFGTWFVTFDWCESWLVVDDVAAVRTPRGDPAARIVEDVSILAPADLRATWPSSDWRFDDPAFEWVYLRVGWDPLNPIACPPMVDPADRYWLRSYAVSALKPYVAYDVSRIDPGPNGDSEKVGIRVRYWAGLLHHFSFFLPSDNRNKTELHIQDLPPEVWDNTAGDITGRGTLVKWWMSFIKSLSVAVRWDDARSDAEFGSTTGVTYECDPRENVEAALYGDTYEEPDGSPTALCFSSHQAFDVGSDEMTSFLGHAVWGEVCFLVKPRDIESGAAFNALIGEGFDALFGGHVKLGFQVEFYGLDGDGWVGKAPHYVRREFCLGSADLRTVDAIADEVDSFRSTSHGRWVFRGSDAARLRESAAAARDLQDCPCGNGVGGGTREVEGVGGGTREDGAAGGKGTTVTGSWGDPGRVTGAGGQPPISGSP